MLLALAGLKGGTGRTTLAVALAAEAHARGRRTLLVDLDPRRDAHAWSLSAGNLAPPTLALSGATGQAERLRALSLGHDLTVIDTPSDPEVLDAVLEVAELALLPCRPSPFDVWATGDAAQACLRARNLSNPRLQFAVIPNAVDPRTTLGASLPEDLRALGLPVLNLVIRRRIAHAEAMAHGEPASAPDLVELFETVEALQAHCSTARQFH
ncbi:MAG: AAA family ATPase [Myxococcales bacterium]|nr:AAA family ATPase [Myxococcales bacterium]